MMFKFQLEIVDLLESRMHQCHQLKVMKSFEREWSSVTNAEARGTDEGDSIWTLWNPRVWKAKVLLIHRQLIHVQFTNQGGLVVVITFAYGRMKVVDR